MTGCRCGSSKRAIYKATHTIGQVCEDCIGAEVVRACEIEPSAYDFSDIRVIKVVRSPSTPEEQTAARERLWRTLQ